MLARFFVDGEWPIAAWLLVAELHVVSLTLLSGDTLQVALPGDATVLDVKHLAGARLGRPDSLMKMIASGRVVENHESVDAVGAGSWNLVCLASRAELIFAAKLAEKSKRYDE